MLSFVDEQSTNPRKCADWSADITPEMASVQKDRPKADETALFAESCQCYGCFCALQAFHLTREEFCQGLTACVLCLSSPSCRNSSNSCPQRRGALS